MKKLIIAGIALAVVVGIGIAIYGYFNGIQKTAVRLEQGLNVQYLDNQNELSSYQAGFYEQVSVANLKADKMNQIISDAVKGRYDKDLSNQTPGTGGALFSAIAEAYPDLSNNLDVYDKIVDYISAKREAYKQKQTKLLSMLESYDTWRNSGIIRSRIIAAMGYPSMNLEARIGTNVKRGWEARDQMYLIVLTEDAKKAYETGVDTPLEVPGSNK